MQGKWKVLIGVVGVAVIAGGVFASIKYSQRDIVTVQTGKVIQEDLASVVTASGTINPKTYINIGAEYEGQLTEIDVKEGDHVRKGQLLAKVDSAQSAADVVAQQAALSSAEADANAAEEGIKAGQENTSTLEATLNRTKADLVRYEADFKRGEELYKAGLIPKSDYDQRVAAYNGQKAAISEDEARITQAKAQAAQLNAQYMSSQKKVAQAQAGLTRTADILKKHDAIAPIDGLVTYLPVRVGETVVPGVQNSAASTIMTIADMSVVTAEVMVDESDIVNIKLGQPAEISVDAIPNKTFTGHVTDIGNTAILRSTGLAASTSNTSSQEAKDFKVVVAMDNPPDEIRPGLSCSAKITTATRKNATAIPIQALTTRTKGDLIPDKDKPVNPDPATAKANKEEYTGVFVVNGQKAEFRKVQTGITGATEIEVLSGLNPGDQIITGSYQTIRTIKNGAQIKIDNTPPGEKKTT
ncbi:MAG TPA: efflux RND transporter periplasmic adaptor subunit [Bryobacteraceae bacterium]|nr:efflux RND transporter periplasmic adaptor subunit [Bryobacteraceae bacterium]